MKVLIIPEDFRKDGYILEPIIKAMLASVGKASARVLTCRDPLLGGVEQALKWELIEQILSRYKGMIDLFLLIVDRDADENRHNRLRQLETKASSVLPNGISFIAEHAWQEIEVWLLAGHLLPGDWQWREIRAERDPKETYFVPFAKQKGVFDQPGQGRKTLSVAAASNYQRIRSLCTEDVKKLEESLRLA